jgi:hypothetical protein
MSDTHLQKQEALSQIDQGAAIPLASTTSDDQRRFALSANKHAKPVFYVNDLCYSEFKRQRAVIRLQLGNLQWHLGAARPRCR